ncbi:GTPase [Undibacterium sp. WLX3042]|uniref:GTPase n=1 Tax=Undibacterium sp. WLX3042 TaxID=3412686 RepID=UPI003C2B99DD
MSSLSNTPNAANNLQTAVPLTLVSGGSYRQREAHIAARIARDQASNTGSAFIAVLLEGLPEGDLLLDNSVQLHLQRIAPGCFCCIGNLTMRVSLNRALRQRPQRVYLGVASSEHLDNLRLTLQQAPYDQLLTTEESVSL